MEWWSVRSESRLRIWRWQSVMVMIDTSLMRGAQRQPSIRQIRVKWENCEVINVIQINYQLRNTNGNMKLCEKCRTDASTGRPTSMRSVQGTISYSIQYSIDNLRRNGDTAGTDWIHNWSRSRVPSFRCLSHYRNLLLTTSSIETHVSPSSYQGSRVAEGTQLDL